VGGFRLLYSCTAAAFTLFGLAYVHVKFSGLTPPPIQDRVNHGECGYINMRRVYNRMMELSDNRRHVQLSFIGELTLSG
jgi:hypothetical protein